MFSTNNLEDITDEVKALLTEKHDFRTLILDSFTPAYDSELDKGERIVGSDWGRHYGYAKRGCKRLFNLLSMLDMNVIVTAHSKNEYGENLKVIGTTFDGWKNLDYLFDLVFSLERRGKARIAVVRKTRLEEFPDQDTFEWSFDMLAKRYGGDLLTREATPIQLATDDQVNLFRKLCEVLALDAAAIQTRIEKAGAETVEELDTVTIGLWIVSLEKDLKKRGVKLEVKE